MDPVRDSKILNKKEVIRVKRREVLTIIGEAASGLLIAHFVACKNPHGPDPPTKDRDIVEFLYERVMPVISPNNPDPSGFTLFSYEYGGSNPSNWRSVGENKWMAEATLKYSGAQYRIWLVDGKVITTYRTVARKIYARIKGSSEWIELTCVKPDPEQDGEQAEFLLDTKGIRVPC